MSFLECDQAVAKCSPRTPIRSKQITRRDTATDDHVVVTASRSSELRRLRHIDSVPRTVTPNRSSSGSLGSTCSVHFQVEPQERCQETVGSPSTMEHPNGLTSPRPYSHVRSVVRDLIDRHITPLEARYGRPVKYQGTPARGDSRSKRSSSACGITPAGEARQGGRTPRGAREIRGTPGREMLRRRGSPVMSQRSTATTAHRLSAFGEAVRRPSLSVSDPHNGSNPKSFAGGNATPRRTIPAGAQETTPLRKIDLMSFEVPHVASVLDHLASARVPANHVPRCAENVPDRYRHQPRTREPWLSPLVFGRVRSERSMSCGGEAGALRLPGRQPVTPSRSVSSVACKNNALGSSRRRQPLSASRNATPRRTQRGSALPKAQQGVERVLLFDAAPPNLAA